MQNMRERIEDRAIGILRRHDTPGATVARMVDGELIAAGVGSCDLEGTEPLAADARFPIYSIAKTFIATVILQLVEAGDPGLHDPIAPMFPDLDLDPRITLVQVMNHTSGLPDYGGMSAYHGDLRHAPEVPWTSAQMLDRTLAQGMRFAPGAGWSYSNIGYLLLKLIVERATGRSFRQVIATRIAEPLGLTRTTVAETLDDLREVTPGFSTALDDDGELHDIADRYHPGWVSHGLIVSTAAEVAIFLDALMTGRLLAPARRDAMLQPVRVPIERHALFREPSYGLGVMLDPAADRGPVVGHGGGGPGYATGALYQATADGHRITVVALANRDHAEIGLEIAWHGLR